MGINFRDSKEVRRKTLIAKAKKFGEKAIVGRLRAIQVLTKNTQPEVSKKALSDSKFIAGSFEGKKYVGEGKGYSRKKKNK